MQTEIDVEKVVTAIHEGLKTFLVDKTNSKIIKEVVGVKIKMYWVNKVLRIDLA